MAEDCLGAHPEVNLVSKMQRGISCAEELAAYSTDDGSMYGADTGRSTTPNSMRADRELCDAESASDATFESKESEIKRLRMEVSILQQKLKQSQRLASTAVKERDALLQQFQRLEVKTGSSRSLRDSHVSCTSSKVREHPLAILASQLERRFDLDSSGDSVANKPRSRRSSTKPISTPTVDAASRSPRLLAQSIAECVAPCSDRLDTLSLGLLLQQVSHLAKKAESMESLAEARASVIQQESSARERIVEEVNHFCNIMMVKLKDTPSEERWETKLNELKFTMLKMQSKVTRTAQQPPSSVVILPHRFCHLAAQLDQVQASLRTAKDDWAPWQRIDQIGTDLEEVQRELSNMADGCTAG